MSPVVPLEANESSKELAPKVMVEGVGKSIAEEVACLCSHMMRITGIKSEGKYQKRETNAAMKTRHYHVHEQDSIENINLSMKFQPFLTGNQTANRLKSMYNSRADPDLGLGREVVQRIPSSCKSGIQK
jgi:hypothetical protein